MPSKLQMVLILALLAAGIWGASRVDWTRDVPRYPPGRPAASPAPGEAAPGEAGPGVEAPPGAGEVPPPPEEDSGEVRILSLRLQRVNAPSTVPVTDPGTDEFVLIRIGREGELFWGGMAAGSYEMIENLLGQNAGREGLQVVVAPDRDVPWQYVHWVIELCREAGIFEIGLGVNPTTDPEKTLLAQMPLRLPKGELALPEDVEELVISVTEDEEGRAKYSVMGEEAKSLGDLYEKISEVNAWYADELGKDYSREPGKTPWVLEAGPRTKAGYVLVTLDAARQAAVYAVRLGGEFPPRPGRKR